MSDITVPTVVKNQIPAQRWALLIGLAVALIAVAIIPQVTKREDLVSILFLVFLYITLGQSWNILAGFAGQINLGHAAFFGVGALVARTLWLVSGFPFPVAFALGGLEIG